MKYLGIDWGERRIGLALADDSLNLSLPFKTVASLDEVLLIIKEELIDVLVLGYPRKLSGAAADNPLFLSFKKKLEEASGLKVILADERLSSLAADALPGDSKLKAGRDEIAAALILQDYLERN
jgi:putative Holliday junction resolvase